MAEESDSGSKTEEATPRKLEEARKRGEVAKSADLASWASLAGAGSVLAIAGGWMIRDLAMKLLPFIAHPDAYDLVGGDGVKVMREALLACMPTIVMVMGATVLAGVFGNVIQQGFILSAERLKPSLDKLSPLKGFGRLFGIDGLVHFLRSVLKITIVAVVAWWSLKPHAAELTNLAALPPAAMLGFALGVVKALFFAVLTLLGVGAGLDWMWQRYRFAQRMRMTKEEVKEDYKQSEGDPLIKAKLRQQRVERARRRMMQNVPKATVVVMNPTHYAVALRYEAGETPAPLCVAKGMDSLALKIREVAEEAGVPVIEDAPLARALYATVEVDESIPREHYEAVAKVIGFVLNAGKKRAGRV